MIQLKNPTCDIVDEIANENQHFIKRINVPATEREIYPHPQILNSALSVIF